MLCDSLKSHDQEVVELADLCARAVKQCSPLSPPAPSRTITKLSVTEPCTSALGTQN